MARTRSDRPGAGHRGHVVPARAGVAGQLLRFPEEDPAGCTRRQLLGREGDRVKRCYAEQAARTGVTWRGRRFTPGDFDSRDGPGLSKTDMGIPVAFEVAAEGPEDIGSRTRRALRDRINSAGLLDRCVRDIQGLLAPAGVDLPDDGDRVALLSDRGAEVAAGRNYGDHGDSRGGTSAQEVGMQDALARDGVIW
ncbi:hypothetical protein GCM10009864_18740 [Streptomyces lunalinharesii]|uniref:Uncharacterized protein n=1 Tax=Streptomyces lunalinharesii TaxID=333384 RepID=A0ABP6DWB2_9ACTN